MKKLLLLLVLTMACVFGNVSQLTDKNYVSEVKEQKEIVIMFSAPWCGACKTMKPIYTKLASSWNKELKFSSIDTDVEKEAVAKFEIRALPTTIVFKDGKEISRKVGGLDKFELMLFLRPKTALVLYAKECKSGDSKACVDLGEAYEEGEIVKKDYLKSLDFYSKACEQNNAQGCAYLAYLYDEEMGVKQDNIKVVKYYKKGCDGNYAWSCDRLGSIYYDGSNDVKVDFSKSFKLFKKACDGGNRSGCYGLGLSYATGRGITLDHKKAIELYTDVCENSDEVSACSNLAFLYIKGKEINPDYKKARYFSEKACNEDDVIGCRFLGYLHNNGLGGKVNVQKAIELYTFACKGKDTEACKNLDALKVK